MTSTRWRYRRRKGHIETSTRHASLPSPQAAVGHREPCGKGDDSEGSQPPGEASFRPTHSETPVVTAFPTSFQRTPWPRRLSLAGAVHPLRNPWSRSAVPIPGVTNRSPRRLSGSQTAGGDGIPMVEPPFKVGTPSRHQPRPRRPSVQKNPNASSARPSCSISPASSAKSTSRGSSVRLARRRTRWRRWGTPVKRESTTRYAQRNPIRPSSPVIADIARPPWSGSMLRTFSSSNHFAGWSWTRARAFSTRPECLPSIPAVRPAWERSVQGNPAVITVAGGRASTVSMSPTSSTSGKRRRSTFCAGSQSSQRYTVRKPALSRPTSMPPMPANRATTDSSRGTPHAATRV